MLQYKHITSDEIIITLFTDNMSKIKRHFTCARVFVTDFDYIHIFPIKSMGDVHHYMKHFFKNVGFPPAIIADLSWGQVQRETETICGKLSYA